jgi:hypothetical protein
MSLLPHRSGRDRPARVQGWLDVVAELGRPHPHVVDGIVQPGFIIPFRGGNICSPSFSWWQLDSWTWWNPPPDLDVSIDVLWTHLITA